jgi:hypothetical protein
MFHFEVLQQPLPVRTEGKKKKSRRILDVTATIFGTQWEDRKKDLFNSNYWWGIHRAE